MRHKPFARGVSHLMYVGDDEAVETATAGEKTLARDAAELAIGGIALYEAFKNRGTKRVVAIGVVAMIALGRMGG